MKQTELGLISELMKNSRKSESSQGLLESLNPTVSRTIKLQKEGVIKEYTATPGFNKLGFELLGVTFFKLKRSLKPEEVEKARRISKEGLQVSRFG